MLRFFREGELKHKEGITIVMAEKSLAFEEGMWRIGRDYFKRNLSSDLTKLPIIPILDDCGETVCYGWQDNEANRELRMLRELEKNQDAKQFGDIYTDIREVVICGCNELAYRFVKYLERLKIPVSVMGKYWEYFGYEGAENIDFDDSGTMVIFAEEVFGNKRNFCQKIADSASPRFECINHIYEENILAGNVEEAEGDFSNMLEKLKGRNVVILGMDEEAQDAYDLLWAHGIDISSFAVENLQGCGRKRLLGKKLVTVAEALRGEVNSVFVEVHSRDSAWGNKNVELFDYYGYERNNNFFLMKDYTDIPFSNLIHILKNKNIILTGDERLCKILSEYLTDIEEGEIKIQYIPQFREGIAKETDILCPVWLPYRGGYGKDGLYEDIISMSYTSYFLRPNVFVQIEKYKLCCADKYTIKELMPKGILFNITFYGNGNIFFKGLADGHPNILSMPYNVFEDNLFSYCIRLSLENPENMIDVLRQLLEEEFGDSGLKQAFPDWERFCRSLEYRLSSREKFTSQELFVIFYIAYAEMLSGEKITDLEQKVIYFDPHRFWVTERPCLAEWLESDTVNVQIITIRRDGIASICSADRGYARMNGLNMSEAVMCLEGLLCYEKLFLEMECANHQYCKRFEVRFEDLKLHSKEELTKICERLEIPWDDSLLHTTYLGKPKHIHEIRDFDIKPVFNKYREYLSEFDRFRLCLFRGMYQKKYGYSYESCLKFSRIQLWELFQKRFFFQSNLQFESAEGEAAYYIRTYELIRWQLYENRKHEVLEDVKPKFKPIELGRTENEKKAERQNYVRTERQKLADFIRTRSKLVLYGLGKDGKALWDYLDDKVRSKLVLCDKKAEEGGYCFSGKQVISPNELCVKYRDYGILVTSSKFYKEIKRELEAMGITIDRIICNTVQLWEGDDV